MADVGQKQDTEWPLPKFYFEVQMAGQTARFQEVSGLDTDASVIQYRSGNSPTFSVKMPGFRKVSAVTLKKGVFPDGPAFMTWWSSVKMNAVQRELVTIRLLDEQGKPTMTWDLANAFVTKVTATDLKATGNEIAVETIDLAHEGVTISNP